MYAWGNASRSLRALFALFVLFISVVDCLPGLTLDPRLIYKVKQATPSPKPAGKAKQVAKTYTISFKTSREQSVAEFVVEKGKIVVLSSTLKIIPTNNAAAIRLHTVLAWAWAESGYPMEHLGIVRFERVKRQTDELINKIQQALGVKSLKIHAMDSFMIPMSEELFQSAEVQAAVALRCTDQPYPPEMLFYGVDIDHDAQRKLNMLTVFFDSPYTKERSTPPASFHPSLRAAGRIIRSRSDVTRGDTAAKTS